SSFSWGSASAWPWPRRFRAPENRPFGRSGRSRRCPPRGGWGPGLKAPIPRRWASPCSRPPYPAPTPWPSGWRARAGSTGPGRRRRWARRFPWRAWASAGSSARAIRSSGTWEWAVSGLRRCSGRAPPGGKAGGEQGGPKAREPSPVVARRRTAFPRGQVHEGADQGEAEGDEKRIEGILVAAVKAVRQRPGAGGAEDRSRRRPPAERPDPAPLHPPPCLCCHGRSPLPSSPRSFAAAPRILLQRGGEVPQAPDEMDHRPALLLAEHVPQSRHGRLLDAVGDPPKNVAVGMVVHVIGGEVRRGRVEGCGENAVAPPFGAVAHGAVLRVDGGALPDGFQRVRDRVGHVARGDGVGEGGAEQVVAAQGHHGQAQGDGARGEAAAVPA